MIKVLGMCGGMHSCGLASLKDGKPELVLEEERHNRIRTYKDFYSNVHRYPYESGQNVWYLEDWKWEDYDMVTSVEEYDTFLETWNGIGLGPLPKEKYRKINHHEAHCNLAYYCSGFEEDTLVISIDASGELYNARYYLGSEGDLIPFGENGIGRKSLGHYYSMLTEFLGFNRLKDEGKVVGMASHGEFNQEFYDIFNSCIEVVGINTDHDNHQIIGGGVYQSFYNSWFEKFGSLYLHKRSNPDVAFNGQLVFEEKVLQLINNVQKQYPHVKKLALAGGIFANVKLNKRINELDWVDEVFIAPPMGDEGLSLGCALASHKKLDSKFKPFRLDNVFLGTSYDDSEFHYNSIKYQKSPLDMDELSQHLKSGKIVGWFQGRYEHGPRALCNRSIIADPSVPGTYKKINDRLQRNDNMPFAPVVIDKYADDVFKIHKSKYTAEFMTMLYDTKREWHNKIPAVVHPIDKTARIQIVTQKSNPKFYKLINKFNDITNIPVLLNTSFNVHGEPIVCHPKEAFVHLRNNIVDILVINNSIYTKNDK